MTFATRFLSYTLLALLVLQGQLHAVRAGDEGPDGPSYGGNGGYGGDDSQAAGWKPHPGPPGPGPHHHDGPWPPRPDTQVLWGQCGGFYYYGTTKCPPDSYCRYFSDWYAQCNPNNN